MKIRSIFILLLLAISTRNYAQLRIQSITGKKVINIGLGKEIGLKRPTTTTNNDCNCCYEMVRGYLKTVNESSLGLVVTKTERTFTDTDGIFKRQTIDYQWESTPATMVPTEDLQAILIYSKGKASLDNLGGILMVVAGLQALAINPLIDGKNRKTADRIVGGVFAVGFTMAILPNKRTYHFEQPSGDKQPLWRLKSN